MTHSRTARDFAQDASLVDLPTLVATCLDDLNRLARQPVMIRREPVNCDDVTQDIALDFGMDQVALGDIDAAEWLRTAQDPHGCVHLVQQLKTLFAAPAAGQIELTTRQRPC